MLQKGACVASFLESTLRQQDTLDHYWLERKYVTE